MRAAELFQTPRLCCFSVRTRFITLFCLHPRMQVLRDNKATLMTCAETFLHDPLVDWARGSKGGSSAAAAGPEAENPQVRSAMRPQTATQELFWQ
jgi:hypothetical protein